MTWEKVFVSENLKSLSKEFQFVMSLKIRGTWYTLFAMLLYQCVHKYVFQSQLWYHIDFEKTSSGFHSAKELGTTVGYSL